MGMVVCDDKQLMGISPIGARMCVAERVIVFILSPRPPDCTVLGGSDEPRLLVSCSGLLSRRCASCVAMGVSGLRKTLGIFQTRVSDTANAGDYSTFID